MQNGDCWRSRRAQLEALGEGAQWGHCTSKSTWQSERLVSVEAASFIMGTVDFIVYDVKVYISRYS